VHIVRGLSLELSASFASVFFFGITGGRLLSGFLSEKVGLKRLTRIGCVMALIGITLILIPLHYSVAMIGVALTGLGAGPFYPALMYRVPEFFGRDVSHSAMGLITAVAAAGATFMPTIIGSFPMRFLPLSALILAGGAFFFLELLNRIKNKGVVKN
jgi:MFS family permease